MHLENGYSTIYDLAFDKFNITETTANRFIRLCENFSIGNNSPELDDKYEDFNVSQLFEMLPMQKEERELIGSDMTVKEIREVKKSLKEKNATSHENENLDNNVIPGQTSIQDFPEYLPESKVENATSQEISTSCTYSDQEEQNECVILEGKYREIESEQQEEINQSQGCSIPLLEEKNISNSLPRLKNAEERKEWLADYKSWGLWYRDENIDVNYYKFDFQDGSRLIACEYPLRECEWSTEPRDEVFYHLLLKNKERYEKGKGTYEEKFRHATSSETYIIEFLKSLKRRKE